MNKIFLGNLMDIIKTLPDNSIDCVITSPPYAEQRKNQYGGIPENDYPQWTVDWMNELKPKMKSNGNVAINIRPHLKDGQLSDYTLKMRLALRNDGWKESEELIWIKTNPPPLGSIERPRRGWESIHWFSLSGKPFCNTKAGGKMSKTIGFSGGKGNGSYYHQEGSSDTKIGISRGLDYILLDNSSINKEVYNVHPAQYPEDLVEWLIDLLCPQNGMVLDPFVGSGTTAVVAKKMNRQYIGIEKMSEYYDIAIKRLEKTYINIPEIDSMLWD